jgi:molecular chaperone GrpE
VKIRTEVEMSREGTGFHKTHFFSLSDFLAYDSSLSVSNPLLAVFLTALPLQSIFKKMAEKVMKTENIQDPNEGMDINTDDSMSGSSHLNEPVAEESAMEALKTELEEANDKYIRKVAEFENFKRRNAKERIELIQTAGKEVITELLDVLDDCDRAQKQLETSQDAAAIKEGVMLVFNKLRTTLQNRGVKPMETLNQDFNADLHEAITEIPAATEEGKGKIMDEVIKGYYLNDKIIRFAKVVVGK